MTPGSKPTWLSTSEPTAFSGSPPSREPKALVAGSTPNRFRMMALTIGLPLLFMVCYFGFYLLNSVGLDEQETSAVVISKQFYEANTSYTSKIVGGRNWVQTCDNPGFHLIQLEADNKNMTAVVPHEEYLKYETGDSVRVHVRTYRLTGAHEVIRLTPHRKKGA